MSGIIRPKKSYDEQRREFNMKRGLPHVVDTTLAGPGKSGGGAEPPAPEGTPAVRKPERPTPPRPPRQARPPRAPGPAAVDETGVVVKLRVAAPRQGTFPLFDMAAASMGEKRALQRLLARSLTELTLAVERGEKLGPVSYPAGRTSLNTTRVLSPALYAAAKAALDPLDLETPGGLARAIGMVALTRYLETAGRSPGKRGD